MMRIIFISGLILMFSMVSCVTEDDPECDIFNPCPEGFTCDNGKCVESSVEINDEDHDQDLPTDEPDDDGKIKEPDDFEWPDHGDKLCEPYEQLFCDQDDHNNVIRCDSTGYDVESVPCGEMSVCVNSRCVQQICTPGEPFCDEEDLSKVYECNKTGTGVSNEVVEDCGVGGFCQIDRCLFYCDIAAQESSYLGCEYFTANLNTHTMRSDPIYALTVSNLDSTKPVTVDITNFTGSGEVDAGKCYFCVDNFCLSRTSSKGLVIDPGKLGIIQFPHEKMVKGTGKHWNSYHIKTDLPVTVYQFSPFDNSFDNPFEPNGRSVDYNILFPEYGQSYSNDASLLMPSPSLGKDYIVSSYRGVASSSKSYATVVGLSDNDTVISIKPTVNISASDGVPAISAGNVGTVTLKKGQIAQIEVEGGLDITGTRIFCDSEDDDCHTFAVFAGADCVNIPFEYRYCDHIEQQMFPVQTWGMKYLLVKTKPRGEEWDYVRILASEDGTTLTFSPSVPEQISVPSGWKNFTVNPVKTEIDAGEYSEFFFKGTLEVEADKPIMVAQYLTGSETLSQTCQTDHTSACVGDPAMMLIPPHEQFRRDYRFLTPGSYESNFATIVMTTGEKPVLNGDEVTGINEIEGTSFSYAIVDLGSEFKSHTLLCEDNPCGLFVYGWEQDVSYAYPGGLNLEILSSN